MSTLRGFQRLTVFMAFFVFLTLTHGVQAQTGSISGIVTDSSGNPLNQLHVILSYQDGAGGFVACTISNGSYAITGVDLDREFRIGAGGSNNNCGNTDAYVREFYNNVESDLDMTTVTLTAIESSRTDINFSLDPGAKVIGEVRTAGNVTLDNADVTVYYNDTRESICTNLGAYELIIPFDTPSTVSTLDNPEFCGHSYTYISEFWNNSYTEADATYFSVSQAQGSITGIDFFLDDGGTISGDLYEADGVTRITTDGTEVVLLDGNTGDWLESNSVGTATSYSFTGLPPGYYTIIAMPNGYAYQYYGGTQDWNQATFIGLPTSGSATADFSFEVGGSIQGHVQDELGNPLVNASVAIGNVDDPGIDTCTDDFGNYDISFLPLNADYTVRAGDRDACWGPSPGEFLIEWWDNQSDANSANLVSITDAQPTQTGID